MIECFKCEGRGVLSYHMNIDNGRCFQCAGSGVLKVGRDHRSPSASESLKVGCSSIIARFLDDGCESRCDAATWARNPDYYERSARKAATMLLTIADTEWARKALSRLDGYVRSRICEIGRELKAS